MQDPDIKAGMGLQQKLLGNLAGYLNRPDIIKKFLQSKETIINKDELAGSAKYKDSIINNATTFITAYEKQQKEVKKAEQSYDSPRTSIYSSLKRFNNSNRYLKGYQFS